MRNDTVATAIALVLLATQAGGTQPAVSGQTVQPVGKIAFAIASQPLEDALNKFAEQTGYQVLFQSSVVQDQIAPRIDGTFTPDAALRSLLSNSGLQYKFINSRTVTISSVAGITTSMNDEGVPSERDGLLRLASADGGESEPLTPASSGVAAGNAASSKQDDVVPGLEEIIVTAQKRSERLQDVPVPVTTLAADTLINNNQPRLQDYYTRIPGLSLTPDGIYGAPRLTIRGITTGGFTNPTVGVTIDDVPFGSTAAGPGGYQAPDIDPSELTRIEVLRGPQGTLYGASSIGGLLKFVTADPSTDRLNGRVQASLSDVHNGDEAGYGVRGSVNVPLSDTWAIRASGFTRRDPGYIDDPVLGDRAVNSAKASGGRLSALWKPTDDFSLKLSALLQDSQRDASPESHALPGLGTLEHAALIDSGWFKKKVESYQAVATARLGRAELTSLTGYSSNTFSSSWDITYLYAPFTQLLFGVPGTPDIAHIKTDKFSQELRVALAVGERIYWIVGGFYTHEKSKNIVDILAVDPADGAVAGSLLHNDIPSRFEEAAAFTNVTVRMTDRFDVQVGARASGNKQRYSAHSVGPIVPGGETLAPEPDSKDHAFTYLLTPRLKLSPQVMAYLRLASGYRVGGINAGSVAGFPPEYDADRTQNYELGVKGDLLGGAFSIDASVYYVDWKDMQILLLDQASASGYYTNGSRAKSQGIELSIGARPVRGLSIAAWAAWNDAKLTKDFPDDAQAYGVDGDRLPNSPRFSGNLSLEGEIPLGGTMTAFMGGTLAYIGNRKEVFTGSPQRETLPSYVQTDIHAGVRRDAWTANLFVNNLADRRGVLTGGFGTLNPNAFTYIQPRTLGLSVSWAF